jgi:hypothetical protein
VDDPPIPDTKTALGKVPEKEELLVITLLLIPEVELLELELPPPHAVDSRAAGGVKSPVYTH